MGRAHRKLRTTLSNNNSVICYKTEHLSSVQEKESNWKTKLDGTPAPQHLVPSRALVSNLPPSFRKHPPPGDTSCLAETHRHRFLRNHSSGCVGVTVSRRSPKPKTLPSPPVTIDTASPLRPRSGPLCPVPRPSHAREPCPKVAL